MHPHQQRLATAAALFLLSACNGETPSKTAGITDPTLTRSIEVSSASSTISEVRLAVGESTKLDAPSSLQRSRSTGWVSSNAAVASVTGTGVAQGRSAGNATITAFGFTVRKVYAIVVTPPAPARVASVAVTSPMSSLPVGTTMQMSARAATAQDSLITDRVTTWSVLSSAAISVSSSGLVTALSAGTATVAATVDGVVGTRSITVTVPPPTVTSFAVTPKSGASLLSAQTRQFATATTWSDLASRAVTVSYTATGGTITNSGLFTAGQLAGTFMVIANCTCGRVDTASVSVSVPAQLTSLTISPKTVSLTEGATSQFAATANWSTGATTLPPLTYSSTGGTVSSAGIFTAPSTSGTYKVIVAHSGGTLSDTAIITVTASGNPIGAVTPFFSDGFESGVRNNAGGFTWGGTSAAVSVSSSNAFSGGKSLRFVFAPTDSGVDSSAEQRFDMGRYLSEVWIDYMIYIPSNFRHRKDPPTNNKFLMLWRDTYSDVAGGTWRIGIEYLRRDDSSSNLRFMSSRWDFNSWTDSGPWPEGGPANGFPLISPTALRPGAWNRVRFHVKAATSRTAEDGEVHLWLNDAQVIAYTRGRFHNAFASPSDAVLKNGYMLGWSNSGFSQETIFYIDEVKFFQTNPRW